jgi:hypothetical protein
LDEEFVVAIETGKDTGQFRLKAPLPTRSRLEHTPLKQNEILETIASRQSHRNNSALFRG